MEECGEKLIDSVNSSEIWSREPTSCRAYDSDSNPFEDERSMAKIKPEVELKEETEGFVYKADTSGHLKLVCSNANVPNSSPEVESSIAGVYPISSHCEKVPVEFKGEFVADELRSHVTQPKNSTEVDMVLGSSNEDSKYSNSFPPIVSPTVMSFSSDQKYMDMFQVQSDFPEPAQQKIFCVDENFNSRCSSELDDGCENKINYHIELNSPFCGGKQFISQVRDSNESSWMYNMQAMRLAEDVINVSDFQYVKEAYEDLEESRRRGSSDNETDLWQLYQELLMQKKMEGKVAQSEEQKREKMREIGRIRARLYRAKLKQNNEAWKKHKAMRAQKQREERLKMSEEQREKIKALARIRAKKHREKLKENEETWKKYKEMRAEKQRLERMKAKGQVKDEIEQLELMRLAEQSEKSKGLARERAKKHRERLKEDTDTWILYKEARAQKKREERLNMPDDQRERLKELARIRAKKYREKLKENANEWKKFKEMRARKQREERMKLSEEEKLKAKALARERAKLYREKKRIRQQMCADVRTVDGSVVPSWYENSDSASNNTCSVFFYQSFLQNVSKDQH